MRTWLKRMVAGIVSAGTLMGGGLLMAGTANADEIRMPDIGKTITSLTASAATTYPRELVNGGFDYLPAGGWNVISPKLNTSRGKFTSVDPVNGQYIRNAYVTDGNVAWVKWDGFDASKFGWISDQKGGKPQGFVTDHANSVELQRDNDTDNTYAEIVGSEIGKSIYQKIDTQNSTDAVYTVRFDHAALSSEHADGMQALVNGKPVTMTRIGGNKAGDKTGWTGTDIVTHATNTDHYRHDGQWATYEGKVTIPANTPVSTFMFKSLNEAKPDMGNLIDNLTFKIAYRLSYDSNGGTKAKASQISSMTEGKASETDGKVRTVADENVRYGSLANGDFSYPSFSDIQENEQGTYADLRTFLKSDDGTLWYNMSNTDLSKYGKIGQIPGFDSSRFAWSSTENGSRVELQQDRNTKNTYAEIVAQQDNTSIYQNVSTGNGGVLYKIRLKHASRQSSHADKMQVLVGSDTAHATPVEMTRVTSNGHGDKVGGKSTTITTKVSNTDPRDHGSQWETYEGYYQVPEGQKNTVFMFKSLEGFKDVETLPGNNVGNLVDDIEFSRSYKLTYDKNASDATGKVPSNQRGKENTVQPAKSKTTGSVGLAADKTASGLTVHDLKKNDKGKVPSNSKADSTQPAAFKAPDAKVETIASRSAGDELAVNGGFDTPKWTIAKEGQGLPWVYVKPNAGTIRSYAQAMAGQTGVKAGGLTAATFAWQDLDAIGSNQNFELHREKDGNTAADVHAGRTVAQTVNTTPGASYTFSIRHSGRSKGNAGGVTLLTGSDKDHLTPVKLTRTTVSKTGQKYGDRIGDVGTVAYTHSDSMDATEGSHDPWDHSDDWESYEGTVIIPAGQSRTMIAYRGVAKDGTLTASANDSIIDDLSFRLAYKLSYDANGGDKTDTSQIKASSDGTVKSIADKTSKVPVHDLEDTDVPGQYRDFILDTTKVKFSDVKFENGAWLNAPMPDSGDGATAMFPLKIGASATLPNVGEWTDGSGHTHSINAVISLHSWNGGSISQLWTPVEGKDLFWINTVGRNSDLPAQVIKALGGIDMSKRVGCQWTVNFTYEDGTPVPDTFRGVTGFNDLDGWDAQPDLKFEGVQLVSGFDGAYKTRDAELATYGINGFAGAKHDSGPESNLDGKQQVKHRLAATWTGSSFTFDYDLQNPEGRDRGCRMTFGVPVTRTKVLTYDANGGKGSVPSHTEAGKVEAASAKTAGSVHAISDATDTTGSAEGKAVSGVLTDTTVDAGDGTKQRTITRSDGSVRVETIADTGAVSGCQVYYPAGTRITLATAKADSDCWDSSQIGKTNRTFYGWSANTDANDRDVPVGDTMDRNTLDANARTEIVMPARAKTVYALWAVNPTLSYNVNAPQGSTAPGTPASRTVPYNTAASDTSGWTTGDTGKIPGYRFDGWYTAPNGGRYDFNTPLTGNVTVYAHWIGNGYTVRFAGNGATGGNTPDQAFQYNIGQNLRRNGFVRDGYTFTGWKRADNQQAYGDGQWVTNLTTQPDGIVTMVAQWSANEAHIRYNPNPPAGKTAGGNGTPNWDGHTGDTPAIRGNGWTIDGYTFAGWTTNADGGGTKYAPGASWTASGTLTLYAQWTPGEAGLTYDGNGATGGKTDPQNGVTDQKVNVRQNGFTRDGYTFVRWDTQADCRGKAVNPGDKWTLQGSSTLYACWTGNMQPLTYHGNGATGGNTAAQSGKTGDELTTNANGFTRDGYTFVRWDTAKDGSGTAYGEGKNGVGRYTMKPTGNDLYAIWQANPANIRYRDDWGATGSTPDTTGVTGQNVTIAQNGFTRPGYTFTGWARDRRTDPSLQPGGRYTLTPGTTTLWAQWKADPAHLIYNSNSGSTSQTRRTDGVVDQTLTVIANPFTRSGYTFTGWNTQADGRGKAYAAGNGFRLVADAKSNPVNTSVLYAQWRINRVALKFNPNGGTGGYPDITVDAFTTVTIPADAKEPKVSRPGFRFTGWAMKPTPGAGDTILGPGNGTVSMPDRGSITVYAQWAPAMTTLPFTGGHAQVPTIGLYAGLVFMILAMGALMPVIRLRMGAGSKGRHAGTPTIGRHSR
ncbi:InlB B-repeat-containing protein [Bifidobacterium longum]|uniref:InlB B-repeat-containing protein n=1 Tax=Bifidobacterium longum TaxID=216816 RepID=UPI001F237F27|nr:InlB B-repeat-containing protein [Bifidobacterium longum]